MTAPATALVATNCCACGRPLTDAVSAAIGMGPDCVVLYGYDTRDIADAARAEANALIHGIASAKLSPESTRGAIFRLFDLGFTDLAKRIERRVGRWIAASYPVATPVDLPIAEEPKIEPLPFALTADQDRGREAVARIKAKRGYAMCVIAGYAGTGKAQPLASTVFTPTGPKTMGDLRVHDMVCTPDGGRAPVTGVFPQGDRRVWSFVLEDGVEVESCEDHLWVVKDRTCSSNLKKWKIDVRRLTTAYIAEKVNANAQGHARFYLENCRPLDFDPVVLPIDPYLLGLLLGNGCFRQGGFAISFGKDSPLPAVVAQLLAPWVCHLRYYPQSNNHQIIGGGKGGRNPLRKALVALGLWNTHSHTKFVPSVYLQTPVSARWAILQGLLDTDGTIGKNGGASFCTASPDLAAGVVQLVRSLGGRANISMKHAPKYVYKGERRIGKPAHIVHISSDEPTKLFRLATKLARVRARAFPLNRAIRRAEFVGVKPVQCIMVDHPDHQYVTDGVVRTHNTTLLRALAAEHGTPIVITPTGKAALRVREATGLRASTIHRWIYKAKEDEHTGAIRFVRRMPDDIQVPSSRLVLLDEASMVSPELWKDVSTLCAQLELKLVLVGDGFQLPPVLPPGAPPFSVLLPEFAAAMNAERIEMTEVLRQAQGSPVIRASMALRNGAGIRALTELPRLELNQIADVTVSTHQYGGVTICHRNVTRFQLNAGIRATLGIYDEMPQVGEPMMVLKNAYEAGVVNGESFNFEGWTQPPEVYERIFDRYKPVEEDARFGATTIGKVTATLAMEELHGRLTAGPKPIEIAGGKWARMNGVYSGDSLAPHVHVNFGYAWTAHKAQGSQWPYVVVIVEPSVRLNEEEGRRWMYTSLTRAQTMAAIYCGRI